MLLENILAPTTQYRKEKNCICLPVFAYVASVAVLRQSVIHQTDSWLINFMAKGMRFDRAQQLCCTSVQHAKELLNQTVSWISQ